MKAHRQVLPAVHILFTRGPQVLLLLRAGTGYRDNEWSLPGGHVEPGETPTAAAVREALEETGVALDPDGVRITHVLYRNGSPEDDDPRQWVTFYAEAGQWTGEPVNAEPHRCAAVRWFNRTGLPTNTVPYIRTALAGIDGGVGYAETGRLNGADPPVEGPKLEEFGTALRLHMAQHNLTYKQAGAASGVAASMVHRAGQGDVTSLVTFHRLCVWAGLDPRRYVGGRG